jgi:DNA modification methylase
MAKIKRRYVAEFPIRDVVILAGNSKDHPAHQIEQLKRNIERYGFTTPILVTERGEAIAGHGRLQAAQELGRAHVPAIVLEGLTQEEARALRISDNRIAELGEVNEAALAMELAELSAELEDLDGLGFMAEELGDLLEAYIDPEEEEDGDPPPTRTRTSEPSTRVVEASPEKPLPPDMLGRDEHGGAMGRPQAIQSRPGDVWILGEHRLMCGDSLDRDQVAQLLNGDAPPLVFCDPPYGMKKEADGVANDNQNLDQLLEFNTAWLDQLLEFNTAWLDLAFEFMPEVGSVYVWGTELPLADVWASWLRPKCGEGLATFRNLITWDKQDAIGRLSPDMRMYPPATERCLFFMKGVQGFNTNADHYFDGWEPLRLYLLESREAMGWDVPTMKGIVGHSDKSRDHWTSKSQWCMMPEHVYASLQAEAQKQAKEKGLEVDAFGKPYAAFHREYEEIKAEFDEIKREYYEGRAYFNNTHANMTDVWNFPRTSAEERAQAGGHATPKPLELCDRAIRSSSRPGELVLDLFAGSGSTLIAAHMADRICYTMELDPGFCDVVATRWANLTGEAPVRESDGEIFQVWAPRDTGE